MPVKKIKKESHETKRDGLNRVYHKDGSVWAKGNMIDGTPDGYWEWFRKSGVILRSGHFEKGKQMGEWITYDKNGSVYKVTQMKTGN
jgi:antitoxin component YwqK of YwqJK toxin-antitoxin module